MEHFERFSFTFVKEPHEYLHTWNQTVRTEKIFLITTHLQNITSNKYHTARSAQINDDGRSARKYYFLFFPEDRVTSQHLMFHPKITTFFFLIFNLRYKRCYNGTLWISEAGNWLYINISLRQEMNYFVCSVDEYTHNVIPCSYFATLSLIVSQINIKFRSRDIYGNVSVRP